MHPKYRYDESSPSCLVYAVNAGSRRNGDPAGSLDTYWRVGANKNRMAVHRIIWEIHNGPIPDGLMIDHINRDPSDNRIVNLRLATYSVNNANRTFKRYYLYKGRWRVRAMRDGKRVDFGSYPTEEAAIACCVENGLI